MPTFLLALVVASVLSGQEPVSPQAAPALPTETPAADESPSKVSVGADLLATSAFVWRGFVDCDSTVLQPDVWVKAAGLTVSSWFNYAPTAPGSRPLTEHDLTVDYSFTRGKYTTSVGWTNYAFLDVDNDRVSNEVYVGLAREGMLSPTLKVFQDLQQGSGTYASLGVQHAFSLGGTVGLAPSLAVGYNRRLYTPYSGFSDAVLGLKATIQTPVKGLALQPFAAYSLSLDDRIATDRFYWGVGASIASR